MDVNRVVILPNAVDDTVTTFEDSDSERVWQHRAFHHFAEPGSIGNRQIGQSYCGQISDILFATIRLAVSAPVIINLIEIIKRRLSYLESMRRFSHLASKW